MKGELINPFSKEVYDVVLDTDEIGEFTGHTFKSPKTGEMVRVMSKKNEPREHAIKRVEKQHNK